MLIVRIAMWCWLLATSCCVHAGQPAPRLADYHRDVWTRKDGAPNDIVSITQTTDGWLWMSTSNGLYRFDGVHFEHFQPLAGEALLDVRLLNLYAAPDGALWFGYNNSGGVSELRDGRLRLHATAQPRMGAMLSAHQGQDGALWVATSTGLLRYAGGKWTALGRQDGVSDGVAMGVFTDQYGNVWANSDGRLVVLRPGEKRFTPFGPAQDSVVIRPSGDGRLWIDVGAQITLVDAPHAGPALPALHNSGPASSDDWLFDRAGNFWTSDCPAGLCLIHAAALVGKTRFRVADTPHDALTDQGKNRGRSRAIFEDKEGNIWAATSEGLERYRPDRIRRLAMDQHYMRLLIGNDGPDALWVVASPPGNLWRVADDALHRIPGDFAYNAIIARIGHPTLFGSPGGGVQRAEGQLHAAQVRGGDGQILPPVHWIGGVFDGKTHWAIDAVRGPVRLQDGHWRPLAELGFPSRPRRLAFDSWGGVWVVYDDKIIDARQTPWRAYGKADGLAIGQLQRLLAQDEVLVLGSTGAAVRIGARFHTLRTHPADLLANAMAGTTSANGDLWINARSGLVRVQAADWKAWLGAPDSLLKAATFDAADGLTGNAAVLPSMMATTDNGNRVWLVDSNGLASIDSTAIALNQIAPRMEIVRLRTDAQTFSGAGKPQLAAGTRKLSLDYTALTYIMPERIRFKYRLDGVDEQWQDGGTRRTVDYTNLGPGNYRFQVLAANEDGVWGTAPATMTFSIAPLFTQTWWFLSLCALAVLGVLVLLYRLRVRSVRKHLADRLHERLHERERIARSLHDTYLQSVQGLVYVFQGLAQRQPIADGSRHEMDRALEMADDVLIQGRNQVMGLRMSAMGATSLAGSLAEIGRTLADNYPMTCTITTSGAVRALRGHVMEEVFCIGREALLNAFRHSQGTRVDMTLCYEANKFMLSIEDDGIGLPAAMLAHGNRAGHWGLPGMRERAETVHGTLAMTNLPAGGVCIVLTVPGRTAYHRPASRWWRS